MYTKFTENHEADFKEALEAFMVDEDKSNYKVKFIQILSGNDKYKEEYKKQLVGAELAYVYEVTNKVSGETVKIYDIYDSGMLSEDANESRRKGYREENIVYAIYSLFGRVNIGVESEVDLPEHYTILGILRGDVGREALIKTTDDILDMYNVDKEELKRVSNTDEKLIKEFKLTIG